MCSNVVECAGSNVPLCTTHKLITSCILLMPYIPAKNFAALVIAVVVFAFCPPSNVTHVFSPITYHSLHRTDIIQRTDRNLYTFNFRSFFPSRSNATPPPAVELARGDVGNTAGVVS